MTEKNLVILFYPKTAAEEDGKNIPLSMLKIGSQLKGRGCDVVVIDERLDEAYETQLKSFIDKAIFIGVSAMTGYQIKGGLAFSAKAKELNSGLPVVWGGWHSTILPAETLKNRNIDIVVHGQGEETACELADAIGKNRGLDGVSGISYKQGDRIVSNVPRAFQDVNRYLPVRFDVIDIERYISKNLLGDRSIFWNSSQGCPYRCGFCCTPTVYNRHWSGLAAEKLLEQLEALVVKYGIDSVTFAEDNFFVDVKRVENLCNGLIGRRLKLKWATDVRIDQVIKFSEPFMRLLKRSGCCKLYIGAESGDQEALDLVDKCIRLEDTYDAAKKLNTYNIISEFFIIVGFPVNPKKDLEASLRMIRNIKLKYPDHQFTPFLYTPYPGTPLFALAVKNGLDVPHTLEGWSNWSILSVSTPWVDKKYLDTVNMYSKCYYPLAFPSSGLKERFKKGLLGGIYKMLHRLAYLRVKKNFFIFPVEWHLVKIFHSIKTRFSLFNNIESFR